MPPPKARINPVTETFFGVSITDPYRWMEDYRGDEMLAWTKAQADYTREYLDKLPSRQAFLDRIRELNDAGPIIGGLQMAGGRVFYIRRDPGQDLGYLAVRLSANAEEKVLFDPNTLEGDVHTAIDWYKASEDGKLVAYGTSPGGSEDSTLYVLDVDSGEIHDLAITRTMFGFVNWLPDNKSFLYSRLPERAPDAPITDFYCDSNIHLHKLGTDPEQDPVVLGPIGVGDLEFQKVDIPEVVVKPDCDYMLGRIMHGDLGELTILVAPVKGLEDPSQLQWTVVASIPDGVTDFALYKDMIYLRTHHDAPRYKIVATPAANPDIKSAKTIVPASDLVIDGLTLAGDSLFSLDMDRGLNKLRRVYLESGEIESIELPFEGSLWNWAADSDSGFLVFLYVGWIESPRIYRYDFETKTVEDTGWQPPSPVDFSDIEAHEVLVTTRDGTQIPLSIIHKKDLVKDGNNPTELWCYGSYGISMSAGFTPTKKAWLEKGGVWAMAHVRGGGEMGKAWHLAGNKLNKENTITDFMDCAKYLIQEQYTRSERLAGNSGSAGGIPTGGAIVRDPYLFAVMVMQVPVTNTLRMEFTENGPPNILEFGSVMTEDGFEGLLLTDAYHKVEDGVAYPTVILTAGVNDPRVSLWMPAKMAARLQAATVSDKPILLRVEYQGGHGMGSTKTQKEEELADFYALYWEQFGMET